MTAVRVTRWASAVLVIALVGCGSPPGADPAPTSGGASASNRPAAPAVGVLGVPAPGRAYFGVHTNWETDSPAAYVARTGLRPAIYGNFVRFPISPQDEVNLRAAAELVRVQGAGLFVTVEPRAGLDDVTPAACAAAARLFARINATGVPVYVRFAHEMNGGWYAWGQQPAAYVAAFRRLSTAVHDLAKQTSLVWAPNHGSGYPYTGGKYTARKGTKDFARLDTNDDGTLTMSDDMYAPFYPGDEYVDWVGLTLFYFGRKYPWGENEVADRGRFEAQLEGSYRTADRDERAIPDFHAKYAIGHDKPMVLAETAAWFNTRRSDGATQEQVKAAWVDQLFSRRVRTRFPRLAMIIWFEQSKVEHESRAVIDWRLSVEPAVLDQFKARLAADPDRYVFAVPPSG